MQFAFVLPLPLPPPPALLLLRISNSTYTTGRLPTILERYSWNLRIHLLWRPKDDCGSRRRDSGRADW